MQMMITNSWQSLFTTEFEQPYFKALAKWVDEEYEQTTVFPAKENLFKAFEQTPYEKVKVVIIGQDPYHGAHQSHGLAFSVQKGVKIPPSLRNIYKELESDLGITPAAHGDLSSWAQQGVLLLNTVLTVREGEANSHRKKGWETFTDHVIAYLNARSTPIVFILWGKPAQAKGAMIDTNKHVIIQSFHPSPLAASRGFFGSRPFSKANQALIQLGQQPIDWQIPPQL